MNAKKWIVPLLVLTLLTAALACNASATIAPTAAPTAQPLPELPTATQAPTATSLPLFQQVTLVTTPINEEGHSPDYTLQADLPSLSGSDDSRAQAFNQAVKTLLQTQIDQFKSNLQDWTPSPVTNLSTFIESSTQVSAPGNILSLQLRIEIYMAGAAHPSHQVISFNYDLEKGQEITLSQLFTPNSDYLKTISDACIAELKKNDYMFEDFAQQGANPTPENYSVWNLSADGLVITFNEYQVAPYAAGPQTVTVPYAALSGLTNPGGPLDQHQP